MIKERIIQVLELKGIAKESFYKKIGISSANFRGKAKKTPLNSDTIANILSEIEDLNPLWLLTGRGEMLIDAPHLEPANWMYNDKEKYESKKHSYISLLRAGLRIDEVSNIKRYSNKELSNILGVDYDILLEYIAGNTPTPISILETIIKKIPDINPIWILTGFDKAQNPVTSTVISSEEKINLMEKIIALQEENNKLAKENAALQMKVKEQEANHSTRNMQ